MIILIGTSNHIFGYLHYIVVIGRARDNTEYIVTDASERLYRVSREELELLMRIKTPTVDRFNAYKIGS